MFKLLCFGHLGSLRSHHPYWSDSRNEVNVADVLQAKWIESKQDVSLGRGVVGHLEPVLAARVNRKLRLELASQAGFFSLA